MKSRRVHGYHEVSQNVQSLTALKREAEDSICGRTYRTGTTLDDSVKRKRLGNAGAHAA